ncbi:hypothetical protein PIB30_110628, partial [Stylosanthes scabra]|nr:hypothetical protein [Stylosanthes scabra]
MIRKCPSDVFPAWLQLQTFYDGLTSTARILIDSSAGGSLQTKTTAEALALMR